MDNNRDLSKGIVIPKLISKEHIKSLFINVSSRRVFRRCRRKWYFYSEFKENRRKRDSAEKNIHFFFGSAIHFSMEDYRGYNVFRDPRRAFIKYYEAVEACGELPDNAEAYFNLGMSMLTYYLEWDKQYLFSQKYKPALDVNGVPLLEVTWELELPVKALWDPIAKVYRGYVEPDEDDNKVYHISRCPRDLEGKYRNGTILDPETKFCLDSELIEVPVISRGTVDGIFEDNKGRLYILDYKTAKKADVDKLDLDDQISSYIWGLEQFIQRRIHGFIYVQLTKDVVQKPKRLKSGALSVDKRQKTTYKLLKRELQKDYPDGNYPEKFEEFLDALRDKEDLQGDRFIRWDIITRNDNEKINTYYDLIGEVKEMLTSEYFGHSPNFNCHWDCAIKDLCTSYERGETINFDEWPKSDEKGHEDSCRDKIKWPTKEEQDAYTEDEILEKINLINTSEVNWDDATELEEFDF